MAVEITTVGIGVDTSDIERGIRSLDDLAARGPKVEKSLDGVEGAAQKAGKAIGDIGGKDAGRTLNQTGESAGKAAGKIADLSGSSGKASDAMREVERSAGALTQSLITGGSATGSLAASLSRLAVAAPGIGLLVGSIAAVTKAAFDGAKEHRAYANALIQTGNISGKTAGQLAFYARAMADANTTQGAAAASLVEFVKAGVKAGDMLGEYAKAAIDWEKATGGAVSKTAQQFAALQDAPLAAVMKLNDGMNFLTSQSYLAIQALQEQGNTTDAARIAQEEYARALIDRSSEIAANLGTLEGAWDGVKGAAKRAWDTMLNVGRPSTLESQLADVEQKIRDAQGLNPNRRFSMPWDTPLADLERERDRLQTQIGNERVLAQLRADNATAVKALADVERIRTSNLSAVERQQRQQIELANAYQTALEKGNLTEAQRAKLEADYLAAASSIGSVTQARATAVRATADAYGPLVQRLQSILEVQQQEMQQGERLSQSQRLQLEIDQQLASGKLKLNDARNAELQNLLASISAGEKYAAAMKRADDEIDAISKQFDALSKAQAAIAKARESSAQAAEKSLQKMREDNEARRMATTLGISQAKAIELVTIKRLEDQRAILKGRGGHKEELEALDREIEARKRLADEIGARDVSDAAEKAAKDAADEWQKTADSISQSLTDALLRGFESGKDFAANFRDTLKNMFKTLVLQPIIAPVMSGVAGMLGGMMPGAAAAGQGGGGASGALGTLSNLGGLTAVGSAFGTGMAASFMSMWNAGVTGWATAAGSLIGSGSAAGVAAGLGMVAAPLLAIGAIAMLGRKKLKDTGIYGTFSGEDFEGGTYQYKKGWFSSSTKNTPFDDAVSRELAKDWQAITGSIRTFADALSLEADRIDGFTHDFKISMGKPGKDEQEQAFADAWAEALRTGSNELAQQLIGTWERTTETVTETVRDYTRSADDGNIWQEVTRDVEVDTYTPSEFARDGEEAIDTLTRLGVSIIATNEVFDLLGLTAYEASLAGADMASDLVDLFGGVEGFIESSANYYDKFFTEQEKFAYTLGQVEDVFEDLNLELPLSRQGFRDVVEGLDLTTEAGREAYAALMGVSDAFDALVPDLSAVAGDLSNILTEGLLGTFDGDDVGAAVADALTGGIENAIAGHFVNQITQILVSGIVEPMVMAATTGASLSSAVSSAAIAEVVRQAKIAMDVMNAVLSELHDSGILDEINSAVSGMFPRATTSARAYTSAVSSSSKAASDAAREADRLAQAWRRLSDVLMDEVARIRGAIADTAANSLDYWQAQFAITTAQARAGDQDAAGNLTGLSRSLLTAAEDQAGSLLELQQLRAQVAQSLQDTAGYASAFGSGQPSVQTRPGVTTITPPSIPRNQPVVVQTDPQLSAEIRQLRETVQTQGEAMRDMQHELVRYARRWDADGLPVVEVTA